MFTMIRMPTRVLGRIGRASVNSASCFHGSIEGPLMSSLAQLGFKTVTASIYLRHSVRYLSTIKAPHPRTETSSNTRRERWRI